MQDKVFDNSYMDESFYGLLVKEYRENVMYKKFKLPSRDIHKDTFKYDGQSEGFIPTKMFITNRYCIDIQFDVDSVSLLIEDDYPNQKDIVWYLDDYGKNVYDTTENFYKTLNSKIMNLIERLKDEDWCEQPFTLELNKETLNRLRKWVIEDWFSVYDGGVVGR